MGWVRPAKVAVWLLSLAPVGMLIWRGFAGRLGANPIEAVTHATGDWTLRFLLLTLAVTPLREAARLPELIRFRRTLGLFAFFYGCLHLTTYLWLDQFFDWAAIAKDVVKRPFITAGAAGFAMMAPLAATSTAGWIRRLGGRRWRMLHRLAYGTAAAGVLHYWWLVKSDVRLPALYAAILIFLLGWRAFRPTGGSGSK